MLLATSCADDFMDSNTVCKHNPDGTFGPFDLVVPFDSEVFDSKTRATFDESNIEMTSAWCAIFDVQTGYLVGMTDKIYNFSDGEATVAPGHNVPSIGDQFGMVFENFVFNDKYNTVYIAGVANYENISAIDAKGNEMSLIEALKNVKTIIDYKNIAVNTASAEMALNGKNRPLMAGFWGNSHGNFTVDLSGKVHTNNSAESKVNLYDKGTMTVTDNNVAQIAAGKIHLRRLYSHLNVNVTVNTSADFTFKNPRVKVYNVPQYTFIQEHKTVENADQYENATWAAATHTAADIYGQNLTTSEISPANKSYNNTSDAAFLMNAEDEFVATESGNKLNIKFGFWHYETKHWGLENVKSQNDRERMHGNSGVYSSLCPSEKEDFNNKAPYIVITGDVSNGKYTGKADFIIHEGNACQANGDLAPDAPTAARDFSTFRNVNYTYNVEINGIDNVITKVTAEDLSGDFYHGTGGEFWSTEVKNIKVAKAGNSYNIRIPKGKLTWCISENGNTPYGVSIDDSWGYKSWYPMYPTTVDTSKSYGGLYNCITLNGKRLGEYDSFDEETECELSFTENSVANGTLYLCGIYTSPDGMVDYYTVLCFNQDGMMIDSPKLEIANPTANNTYILGLNDHTIRWKEVEGADSYTVTLGTNSRGGGYTVTLKPGQTTTDSGGLGVTLTRGGDGYLYYTMRYARSQNALLSLVDDASNLTATATYIVTANSDTGAKSDPANISMTVVNPVWDFNSAAWKSVINPVLSGTTIPASTEVGVNGLTLYTGTNTMTYNTYGSYYAVMTGGSGSTANRGFKFHAFANGKVNAWTSSNTGNQSSADGQDDRYVYLSQTNALGGNTETQATSGNRANKSVTGTLTKSPDIPVDPVTKSGNANNVWVYPKGSIVIYKIQFTPQDR